MLAAIRIKSYLLSARTWTEATILVSDSCHTCSSWSDRTPGTAKIDDFTSSSETVDGTPCKRMREALRTVRP